MQSRQLGEFGEDFALATYRSKGYELVARNWRTRNGEIDLIISLNSTLVFCEVKTRSTAVFGSPAEAVTGLKQTRIRSLAGEWLGRQDRKWREIRFDVASITKAPGRAPIIELIEGAF